MGITRPHTRATPPLSPRLINESDQMIQTR
jgi:hypothetical protein